MVDHVLCFNFLGHMGVSNGSWELGIAVRHEHEEAKLGLECAAVSILRKGAGRTG